MNSLKSKITKPKFATSVGAVTGNKPAKPKSKSIKFKKTKNKKKMIGEKQTDVDWTDGLSREQLRSARKSFRLGCVGLPKDLQTRISEILKGYPRKWLREDAAVLSELLRSRTTEKYLKRTKKDIMNPKAENIGGAERDPLMKHTRDYVLQTTQLPPLEYNKRQAMAYVAHRVAGIYSCNYRVLNEIKRRFPRFQPLSILDFGTGPGTATWAAKENFPSLSYFRAVESSQDMIDVNNVLLQDYEINMTQFLLQGEVTREKSQLVIASYSLSELADDSSREAILKTLWSSVKTKGFLVLIEPGTPIGFRVIRNARTLLNDMVGADETTNPHIVSPCTHSNKCPLGGADNPSWCHFTQRVQRLPQSLEVKKKDNAFKNYENEKFSYIIFSKGKLKDDMNILENTVNDKPISQWGRLIRQPIKKGGHVILDTCQGDGSATRLIVSKSDGKILYTSARKSKWGDVYNTELLKGALDVKKDKLKRPWKDMVLARKLKRGEITQEQYELQAERKIQQEKQWLPHEIE